MNFSTIYTAIIAAYVTVGIGMIISGLILLATHDGESAVVWQANQSYEAGQLVRIEVPDKSTVCYLWTGQAGQGDSSLSCL